MGKTHSVMGKNMVVVRKVYYFEEPGPQNTEKVLEIVKERLKETGIKYVVLASTRGETAFKALKYFDDLKDKVNLIIVTHAGASEYEAEDIEKLRSSWATVLTCPHVFGWGVGDALRKKYQGFTVDRIIAEAYRRFSEGVKVAVEIALMATDSALIPPEEEVVAIAGTGRGADTALIIKTAYTRNFTQLKIREVLAMPR